MPAHRKPAAILTLTGSRRAKLRANEPDTGRGIGEPPRSLPAAARRAWREVVADCAPGVFQSSDRAFLALLAMMLAQLREDPANFGARKHALLLGMLARCGMTPADRSRVAVRPAAPTDGPGGKPRGLAGFR